MKKILTIGIVGCGAIGSSLARAITEDRGRSFRLSALYDLNRDKAASLSRKACKNKRLSVGSLAELIDRSELVIECSCAKAAWEISRKTIRQGKSIMVMSVGGIVGHIESLRTLARMKGVQVYIPSGAIAGLDGIKASSFANMRQVTLTTTKPALAFQGVSAVSKRIDLKKLSKDVVLFSGKAKDAVKRFPQNINVAGVLSIAGIGQERTRVVIRASGTLKRNIHEIEVKSDAGSLYTRTENVPHPQNNKTSYLAVLSAIAMLRQMVEPVRIGT